MALTQPPFPEFQTGCLKTVLSRTHASAKLLLFSRIDLPYPGFAREILPRVKNLFGRSCALLYFVLQIVLQM